MLQNYNSFKTSTILYTKMVIRDAYLIAYDGSSSRD